MSSFFESITGIAVVVGSFLLWCYGIAVCIQANEIFWAVVSFAFFPVGLVIGVWNIF